MEQSVTANDMGRKCALVFTVYFAQGFVPGFSTVALIDYFTVRGASLAAIGATFAIVGTPWVFAFIWGPVVDRIKIFGLKRRQGWIFTMAAAGTLPLICLGYFNTGSNLQPIAYLFAVHSVAASIIDAATDALSLEMTTAKQITKLHAWSRVGMIVGTAVSAFVFAPLLASAGLKYSALVLAACWVALFVVAALLYKPSWEYHSATSVTGDGTTKNYLRLLLQRISARSSLLVVLAIGAAYLVYSVIKIKVNYSVVAAGVYEGADFSQFRSAIDFVVAFVMLGLSFVWLSRTTVRNQVLALAGVLLLTGIGALVAYSPGIWQNVGVIFFTVAASFARILLYLTACRVFALVSGPETAGAQFSLYMASINGAEVLAGHLV